MIFALIGLLIIISSVIGYFLASMPLTSLILGGTVGSQLTWISQNLELLIPFGVWLFIIGQNPRLIVIATIISVVMALYMWGVMGL